MKEDAQKGMFDAFHILKKIADNLNQPVRKYGKAYACTAHLELHYVCMKGLVVSEWKQAYCSFLSLALSLYIDVLCCFQLLGFKKSLNV